jgi:hypothetical protein
MLAAMAGSESNPTQAGAASKRVNLPQRRKATRLSVLRLPLSPACTTPQLPIHTRCPHHLGRSPTAPPDRSHRLHRPAPQHSAQRLPGAGRDLPPAARRTAPLGG